MILLAEAERAGEISRILDAFRNSDPNSRNAIESTIDFLKDLSIVLNDLDRFIDVQGGVPSKDFADDLELLQHSVAYTLGDLWTILGSMPDECIGHDYRAAWKDIMMHCRNSQRQSLQTRLEMYTLFAAALCRIIRREPPKRGTRFTDLRQDIIQLRRTQLNDRRLITAADAINDLSSLTIRDTLPPPPPSPTAMRQPRSTERVRPPDIRTMSPTESNTSRESRPFVPSPPMSPQSPTATFSTISSQASSGEVVTKHWAGRVFKDLPSTRIVDEKHHGESSTCHPYQHDKKGWPDEAEFERIFKIHFPGGLRFHYYVRGSDWRAKIGCEWPDDRRRIRNSSQPLNELHVKRDGSVLYLCRAVAGYSNNTVWAVLHFPTIEFLVVFHLTFLALRSQDSRKPVRDIFDRELKGETRVFAGAIKDSEYHHALRLYRDRFTGTLRLEAAVLEGRMKDTPIWTAFITHNVTSPTWLERADRSKKVYLADLKRHIFSSEYTAHVAPSGQHVLAFDKSSDAEAFDDTIKELGVKYWEEARRRRP